MVTKKLKEWFFSKLIDPSNGFSSLFADSNGGFNIFYYANYLHEAEYPYLVYQFVGGNSERDSKDLFDNPQIQITIISDDPSSVKISSLGDKVDGYFNGLSGDTGEEKVLNVVRFGVPIESKNKTGNWQWTATYQISLQKIGV